MNLCQNEFEFPFEFPTIRAELVHSLPGVDINQLVVEGWKEEFLRIAQAWNRN